MDDLLALEPLLKARLSGCVDGLAGKVFSRAELAAVEQYRQAAPAAHIVYAGYRVLETKADGRWSRLEQRWYVAIAVKHAGDQVAGDQLREEAGPMLAAVGRALMGWKPSAEHGCLALITAPAPVYRPGFAFFPLMFATTLVVKGDPDE